MRWSNDCRTPVSSSDSMPSGSSSSPPLASFRCDAMIRTKICCEQEVVREFNPASICQYSVFKTIALRPMADGNMSDRCKQSRRLSKSKYYILPADSGPSLNRCCLDHHKSRCLHRTKICPVIVAREWWACRRVFIETHMSGSCAYFVGVRGKRHRFGTAGEEEDQEAAEPGSRLTS